MEEATPVSSLGFDSVRTTLNTLIAESRTSITADEILREFRSTKEKRSNRKLLEILQAISRNQHRAEEHLQEAAKNLERKDPFYCLLKFLENYSQLDLMHSMRKKDISTSTPLLAKRMSETSPTVLPDSVNEIRERLAQATNSCISRPTVNHSIVSAASGGPVLKSSTSSVSSLSSFDMSPALCARRTDSIWDFHTIDNYQVLQRNVLATPISSQEQFLTLDIIYTLIGMRSTFVCPINTKFMPGGGTESGNTFTMNFIISEQIHTSLSDIAMHLLPLASHYICIQKFVEAAAFDDSCGQVLQALSQALNSLMSDYYLLLCQLENQVLNGAIGLHKVLYFLRPTIDAMEVLAGAVSEIIAKDLRGGAVLSLLCDKIKIMTGSDGPQLFVMQLTQLSAVPYMDILQLWIQKGVICDPFDEFLVEDNEVIRREELPEHYSADYWEKRYTIRRDRIPYFLEKVSDMILRTGKYLNVIRQCGKKVTPPQSMKLEFSTTNHDYITVVENAYSFASKNLLEVLLQENDLMGHLMSVKRYLLLYQGDFISQFMDACEEELAKNVDQVLPMKLENLLGLTLRLSSAKHDPYKDDVHCELLTYDLVTQMSKIMNNEEEYWLSCDRLDLNGLECFAFRYEVMWPVSLVLNHIAISKYQMIFRLMFYCKHVERQLCKIWMGNSMAKKFTAPAAELYRSAFTLRQRMMNAIQNLEYYMMIEVIEPNWHIFIQKMEKVENVDDVLIYHQDFLDSCLKNCMLTDTAQLNRAIFKLGKICLKFCDFLQKAQRLFVDAELTSMVCESDDEDVSEDISTHVQSEASLDQTETFSESVRRFDLQFTGLLITLLKQINDIAAENPGDRFINLVHRINFNSFYNEQMDLLCAKDSMVPRQ